MATQTSQKMKPSKELRNDPHRPSSMNPEDYVFIGAADDHPGRGYIEIRHDVLARNGVETGVSARSSTTNVPFYDAAEGGRPNYRCHHCGKHGSNIRYFCFFLHKPSKQVIIVGQICAERFNLGTKDERDFQKRRDEQFRREEESNWATHHEAEYNFLKDYNTYHKQGGKYIEFLDSLWDQVQRSGRLSDNQVAGLCRWMDRPQDWTGDAGYVRKIESEEPIDADRHRAEVIHHNDPPTNEQRAYLYKLAEITQQTVAIPDTRAEASDLINKLKAVAGLEPASSKQLSYINSLLDARKIPTGKRQAARVKIDAGLTKKRATACIDWLKTFPISDDVTETRGDRT